MNPEHETERVRVVKPQVQNNTSRVDEFVADHDFQPTVSQCLNFATKLESELAEAREQHRLSSVCRELRWQRDRLAEALRNAIRDWESLLKCEDFCQCSGRLAVAKMKQVLAAVKGGNEL